jgi:hypothetical protein
LLIAAGAYSTLPENTPMLRFIAILTLLLLAACNLQQQPPSLTAESPSESDPQTAPSPVPAGQSTSQPTLLPTPTQITLVTATLPVVPTTIDIIGGGAGAATLDASQADERYPIEARSGATLGVNYEVTIGARGVVSMTVQGPDGLLWQKTFTTSETGRAEVQIEQGGTYEILVFRQNLDGSYAVSWD